VEQAGRQKRKAKPDHRDTEHTEKEQEMKKIAEARYGGISDAAVRAKTGKGWKEWFAILDRAGATKMSHRDIATYIYKEKGCPGWWAQMVTVGYEQARGLREKYQKADGYAVSRSKTVGVPVRELFEAWSDAKTRRRWLDATSLVVRKATAPKSMRITWVDGKTSVEVNFYPKGAGKSRVSVQHTKLADAKDVEKKRAYWNERLEKLAGVLEGARE
jgi:uncharacterized protein YndB with AHSA1/START domain